jgi:HEAT repeat protein
MRALKDEVALIGLLKSLKHPHPDVRERAARAFSHKSLEPGMALRQLTRALADPDAAVRASAVQGLGAFGAAAVPLLVEALKSPEAVVRQEAVWALQQLGPIAWKAVPVLTMVLDDPDRVVCRGAVRALAAVGPAAHPAIPALARSLQASDMVLCRLAASALARIGIAAVPALLEALNGPDRYAGCEAAWALAQLGPGAQSAVPALVALLRSEAIPSLRRDIEPTLPASDQARTQPIWLHPRRGSDDAFWVQIIKTLAAIGPAARLAIPELRGLLDAGYGTIQLLASQALQQIEG